ncbi:MAG TPA: hypothetical protein VEJ89_00195 [Myxococcaceae bacterium]|nr:hypothetical protein [Myxococcaceae bacterium]
MPPPPLSPVLRLSHRVFSALHERWESRPVQRLLANGLVGVFLAAFCLIEARRRGWLPGALAAWVPTNHFHSVQLAFTLLLGVEVISLVFGMSATTGTAMGKQFEILSLILLRQSLKELVNFPEPIQWIAVRGAIPRMLADATAALLVFGLLGVFYRLQRRSESRLSGDEQARFTASKELVALVLLAIFVGLAVEGFGQGQAEQASARAEYFFEQFYTVLVFADILIVLLALRHGFEYDLVFRNSGFAAVTVLIRLALTAPPFVNGALGVGATVLGIGLTWAYNRNVPLLRPTDRVEGPAPRA